MEFNYACAFVYSEHGSWKGESACCIGIISIVITFVSKYSYNNEYNNYESLCIIILYTMISIGILNGWHSDWHYFL